jgi:hypothetical protein
MPSGPMLKWRTAGSWLLALVLTMARDRLSVPCSRWFVSAITLSARCETANSDSLPLPNRSAVS